ncbi:MAG: DUF2752 domain-containing protein, partial [Candidatus Eiseniibacteriota bacterium]
ALSLAVVALVAGRFAHVHPGGLAGLLAFAPACPFHVWTGWPCPTCGSTRAALALLSGDPWTAFSINPLATLALVGGSAVVLFAPAWVLAGGPVPVAPDPRAARWLRGAIVFGVGLNWIYLIVQRI